MKSSLGVLDDELIMTDRLFIRKHLSDRDFFKFFKMYFY